MSPLLAASANALGTAVGDSALGLQTPYYEPPQLADPSDPGYTVAAGADQPDPFVYVQGGEYYLFTSQDDVPQNVPVRSGPSMGQWGAVSDALPDLPPWSVPGKMWAPDVAQFGNHYVLFFTSQLAGVSPQTMCIGDAVSTAVAGPYLASPTPFICQQSLGGSIDPRVFVDRTGQPYMIWKSDQNARADQNGLPTVNTQIWSQPLSADGLRLLGAPTVIMVPDEPWQNHIVEAPQLELVHGEYWIFYSGGWFNQTSYAIGAARCAGPLGPCIDTSSTPLLASNAQGQGPGEESVVQQRRRVLAALHPVQFDLALARTTPAGADRPPRLRPERPLPGAGLVHPLDVRLNARPVGGRTDLEPRGRARVPRQPFPYAPGSCS